MEEFNAGKGYVFLISLIAGDFGLNFTGVNDIMCFDHWLNPAVDLIEYMFEVLSIMKDNKYIILLKGRAANDK